MSEELGWVPFVGQKVCCVDDSIHWTLVEAGIPGPVKGLVYTIAGIAVSEWNTVVLWFDELSIFEGSFRGRKFRAAYHANNFRPVVERKTSIAIFEAMLVPKKGKVIA